MRSDHFEAFTCDGEAVCLDCGDYDSDNPEMSPIFADSEWDSYPCCAYCGERFTYVSLTDRGRRYETGVEIEHSLARTAWASAWADLQDELGEEGENLSGRDILDAAPETPPEAYAFAGKIAARIAELNGFKSECRPEEALAGLFMLACVADMADGKSRGDAEEFGSDLALMVLGHGVSWFDDHAKFPLVKPYAECHAYLGDDGETHFDGSVARNELASEA